MQKILVFEDICKGCKLCVTACPKGIMVMDEDKLNSRGFHPATVRDEDMEKCSSCAFCAIICPDVAIEVRK